MQWYYQLTNFFILITEQYNFIKFRRLIIVIFVIVFPFSQVKNQVLNNVGLLWTNHRQLTLIVQTIRYIALVEYLC